VAEQHGTAQNVLTCTPLPMNAEGLTPAQIGGSESVLPFILRYSQRPRRQQRRVGQALHFPRLL
jgi:hypothetical protein